MFYVKRDNLLLLEIYVQPNASKNHIDGLYNGKIKIRIKAPPIDDKANEMVVSFVAKSLGVKSKHLRIMGGDKSRTKILAINTSTELEQDDLINIIMDLVYGT